MIHFSMPTPTSISTMMSFIDIGLTKCYNYRNLPSFNVQIARDQYRGNGSIAGQSKLSVYRVYIIEVGGIYY